MGIYKRKILRKNEKKTRFRPRKKEDPRKKERKRAVDQEKAKKTRS